VKQFNRSVPESRPSDWGIDLGRQLTDLSQVDAATLIEIAEKVGKYLAREMNLKMNQIRRFLDAVRRIEADWKSSKGKEFQEVSDAVVLLRPKLAYAAGREKKVIPLLNVLDPAIKSGARSEKEFMNLLRLIEGIVAYHRFAGGNN